MKPFKKIFRWRHFAQAAFVAGALSGCENVDGNGLPENESIKQDITLSRFSGSNACAELEAHIEDKLVLQMRSELSQQRDMYANQNWWGGWRGGIAVDGDMAAPMANAGAESFASGEKSSAPTDYTQTNNQVEGVDEADFVKNDGTRIFTLTADKLYAVKSWPAEDMGLQGSIKIEGWPRELFLVGEDKAVVFSSVYTWYPMSHAYGAMCDALSCGYYSSNTVKVTELDVSDLTDLKVVKEVYLPGNYLSARKIDSSVRLVLTDGFNYPDGYRWGPDWEEGLWDNPARLRDAYNRIIATNEILIRSASLAQWLPPAKIRAGGQVTEVAHACEDFSRVNGPTRAGQVSVVTLNLDSDTVSRNTILAEAGEVYASQNNLYVATQHWWWWPSPGQEDTTYIHKFDISDPVKAEYRASGGVPGRIVDQFSIDEAATGELRVVTTINRRVPDTQNPDNWWGNIETANRLSVLRDLEGRLKVIGKTEDLAKGETVQSARIVGNRGYVVTFRQVDPLFTFDLSDPAHPTKLGEVKIPGFSSYMHPLDENHLLTIGTYMDEEANWQTRRLQLAIFDVTDMANPVQSHQLTVGSLYGYSEAQHEHKAFNYFAAKKLLAIPFFDWNYSNGYDYWYSFTSDLRVFSVDAETGFTAKGSINFKDVYQVQDYYGWSWYYQPYVRRSVMADDFVYAIADSGIRVAHIDDLSQPVKTVTFPYYVETHGGVEEGGRK